MFNFLLFGNLMKLFGVFINDREFLFWLKGFIVGIMLCIILGVFLLIMFFVWYVVFSGYRVIGFG